MRVSATPVSRIDFEVTNMAGLTLLQLRTQAKRRADMEGSSFLADAEWTDLLNEAGSELHDIIIRADPGYFRTTTTINVVANTETYSLAALSPAFYKLIAIFWMDNGYRVPMRRFLLHDLDPDYFELDRTIADAGRPHLYDVLASDLLVAPKPTAAGSIQLWYTPQYVRKSADGDTFDYPIVNGWEQFIVLVAAMKALIKEGSDISQMLVEKAALEARILNMARVKDQFSTRRMRDVYGTMRRSRRFT
jgi:hypothetical protein